MAGPGAFDDPLLRAGLVAAQARAVAAACREAARVPSPAAADAQAAPDAPATPNAPTPSPSPAPTPPPPRPRDPQVQIGTPPPVRAELAPDQLELAARLYDTVSLAMDAVVAACDREYTGDPDWTIRRAAVAVSQLLHFVQTVAGISAGTVQTAAFQVLADLRAIFNTNVDVGMKRDETVDHTTDPRVAEDLRAAIAGFDRTGLRQAKLFARLTSQLDAADRTDRMKTPGDVRLAIERVEMTLRALTVTHGLSVQDPRLGRAAALADESAFDPDLHQTIAAIMAGESDDDDAASSADGPLPGFLEIAETAGVHGGDGRLVIALNARSTADYRYHRPVEVHQALDWLATVYRDAMIGDQPRTSGELDLDLRQRCGWHYRSHQSPVTAGEFPDWYRTSWDGRTLDVHAHIGRGDTKRLGNRAIRLAFTWDEVCRVVVVGFAGQHQRTRQT